MSTWMVVEDEPDIYEVLLAMFEMWGIEGAAFTDGEDAVAWIDDVDRGVLSGELPELALLDIRLPGLIDGPKVGERLRKSPQLHNIAVVLTTAYHLSPEEEKQAMTQAGADRLIYKPLPKFNELKKLLEDLIAERRARSGAEPGAPEVPATPPAKHLNNTGKATVPKPAAPGSAKAASTPKPATTPATKPATKPAVPAPKPPATGAKPTSPATTNNVSNGKASTRSTNTTNSSSTTDSTASNPVNRPTNAAGSTEAANAKPVQPTAPSDQVDQGDNVRNIDQVEKPKPDQPDKTDQSDARGDAPATAAPPNHPSDP